jgi:TRAP-type uncharacterized transport system fused permease subunit
MRVAFSASRVALPALIVPFMFVYSPALLLKGSALDVIVAGVPALLGLLSTSVALIGYWIGPLRLWERALALVAGALLVFPGMVSDGIGIALMVIVAISSSRRRRAGLIEGRGPSRP